MSFYRRSASKKLQLQILKKQLLVAGDNKSWSKCKDVLVRLDKEICPIKYPQVRRSEPKSIIPERRVLKLKRDRERLKADSQRRKEFEKDLAIKTAIKNDAIKKIEQVVRPMEEYLERRRARIKRAERMVGTSYWKRKREGDYDDK